MPGGHRIRFGSATDRDAFLRRARVAVRAASAPGRYAVLRELGAGASGVVYVVRRHGEERHLALKAVPKPLIRLQARLAHLVAERIALGEAAARDAACIVRLVDAFETSKHFCFVTELAAFGDLRDVLKRLKDGRVREGVGRGMFAEVVTALEECHRMGFLFRDMKLANLLVDGNGHVRLADFGLVKRMEVEVEASEVSSSEGSADDDSAEEEAFRLVGRTTTFVGTRRFMSPEHVKGRRSRRVGYGAPSDVWAAGVCLYVMLTGQYPFGRDVSAKSASALYYAIQYEEIDFPEWLSTEAVDLLSGMLHRDARKRLDIAAVKAHPWMRGVDWARVRKEAREDTLQEEVLKLMLENEIEPVGVGRGEKGVEVGSSISGSGEKKGTKISEDVESYDLLGFGYVPCPEHL